MNVPEFQAKWRGATLKECSAAHEHFTDLCRALGVPTPAEADPNGTFYAFERGAEKTDGGQGWADVWFRGHFAWEYKGPAADLKAAYRQLRQYVEDLENPPLLVVSDLTCFEVHTNFTGTVKRVHAFTLDDLDTPETLAILRAVWTDPERLRPTVTPADVTEAAAARFGALAAGLHGRGVEPRRAAHFLVQLLLCLFAEDVGLLPKGLFTDLLARSVARPERFPDRIAALLTAMRDGGDFGAVALDRFNGGLFVAIGVESLTGDELRTLAEAGALDWGSVEPAIFGTLFERSLDPAKRAQLGAHYTGRPDIERVVEPVLMAPLRRRWVEVRATADELKATWDAANAVALAERRQRRRGDAVDSARAAFSRHLFAFQEELAAVTVLDPACGSGNFLYVALAALKDLEKAVIAYGTTNGLPAMLSRVGPGQLHGLEVNEYAHEIAQVVVWIGYLQWMTANGFQVNRDPVLEPLGTIRLQDALLDRSEPGAPKEAAWPAANFIIGNPPFLGGSKLRRELGDDHVENLWRTFSGSVPNGADLCCYFFEKAGEQIKTGQAIRAGLLATNSVRGGLNRRVLDRIKESCDIFLAWSDEPWVLDGAAVRISIVGFDDGTETERTLNGAKVSEINSDLTGSTNLSSVKPLVENKDICLRGNQKGGVFDVSEEMANAWLALPQNPNGRPNSDVLRPYMTGVDIVRRPRHKWLVDFGIDRTLDAAAFYEAPFGYVAANVRPERERSGNTRPWWLHERPRPELREKLRSAPRYIATPHVSKHRLFVWLSPAILPDHMLCVFLRADDYFFGVLHSRVHEVWSLRLGTWLGVGNDPRYTPTTCFETFPLPWPPAPNRGATPASTPSPPPPASWTSAAAPGSTPPGADPAALKQRTLTNLYNERPTWLANLHAALDRAVWAAYGWEDAEPGEVEEDAILARLLALNGERARPPIA